MKDAIKQYGYTTLVALVVVAAISVVSVESVEATDAISESTKILKGATARSGINQNASIPSIAAGVINQIIGVLGVIAVALVVYGGGLWLTAAGNDTKVQTAKKIIVRTVIGTIIIGLAYAITAFVFTTLVGTPS